MKTLKEAFESDDSVVRELVLFIDNDGDLYRQRKMPIMKNLARKMRKGKYDPKLAVKLWMYLVDDGAKKYARDHGGPGARWHEIFPKAIRLLAAKEMAEQFQDEVKNEEWDLDKLAMREGKSVKVSKTQLKEMVREAVRAQLNEAAGAREWDLLEKLRDAGASDTAILEDLMRAMSSHEAVENLEHIARMWDVRVEDEDEEDEDDWDLDEMAGQAY